MESFNLPIDGRMVPGDMTMLVINPATEETLAECPRASPAQLNQAVAAAKAAFPAWAATPIDERRKSITQIADAIEKNCGDLARLLTLEQGTEQRASVSGDQAALCARVDLRRNVQRTGPARRRCDRRRRPEARHPARSATEQNAV